MKPYIQMDKRDSYILHVPVDLIFTTDEENGFFDHYFRCTFNTKNLNDLFKESNLQIKILDDVISAGNVSILAIDSLGVYKINVLLNVGKDDWIAHTIKLWVVKKGN